MATSRVALSRTSYTQINTALYTPLVIEVNEGVAHVIVSSGQPALGSGAYHRVTDRQRLVLSAPDTNVWALSVNGDCILTVTEQIGVIEQSDRGGNSLAVTLQDQSTPAFDLPFVLEQASTAVRTATSIDSRVIDVTSGHALTAGQSILLANGGAYMEAGIVSTTVDTITIDTPINHVYPVGATVTGGTTNLIVDGTTPQTFKLKPPAGTTVDITSLTFSIRSNIKPTYPDFGADPELTLGVIVRRKLSNGDYTHLTNMKSNEDFLLNGSLDISLEPKTTGSTVYGIGFRMTFAGQQNHGVAIRLDSALDEEIQIIIQDNLTGGQNTSMRVLAQGSEVQGQI